MELRKNGQGMLFKNYKLNTTSLRTGKRQPKDCRNFSTHQWQEELKIQGPLKAGVDQGQ